MKKQLVVFFAALFIMGSAFAQGQRMSVDERVSLALDKIEASLKPSEAVRGNVKVVLIDFYTKQQKAMEDMRASGSPSREEMMKIRKELSDERDAKLKTIFTEEQMTKWTTEIEPSLRPQRPAAEKDKQ